MRSRHHWGVEVRPGDLVRSPEQSRQFRGIGLIALVACADLGLVVGRHSPSLTRGAAVAVGLALAAFFFVSSARMGVVVSQSGVRVRNWIRTIELPWTTVERFEIPDRWPWTAQVVLNQGGSVRVWGAGSHRVPSPAEHGSSSGDRGRPELHDCSVSTVGKPSPVLPYPVAPGRAHPAL